MGCSCTLKMFFLPLLTLFFLAISGQTHGQPAGSVLGPLSAESLVRAWPRLDAATARMLSKRIYGFTNSNTTANVTSQQTLDSAIINVGAAAVPVAAAAACPVLPPRTTTPTRVADLHPCDVAALGAIGDSLTEATNAESSSLLDMGNFRGVAWSIGGDPGAITMPNTLSAACGTTPIGPSTTKGSSAGAVPDLNYAVAGAVVQDMPGQAERLVEATQRAMGATSYASDWKVISVLIGGNNLCLVCDPKRAQDNDEAVYKRDLGAALDILTAMPRTVVNVVLSLDYTELAPFKTSLCSIFLPFVCDCLTTTDADKLDAARAMIKRYNAVTNELIAEFKAKNVREDVAVVVQPFTIDTVMWEKRLIAVDCFHPSTDGQGYFGLGLWNNMLQPVGSKSTLIDANTQAICPTQESRIWS